ncbi:MAG TPA: hypothetical protein VHY10_06015 [Xanthobacteraceae bacterium]|jgi:hypothetical protein|nr:hypothetical protein [Xanthobacteraceae bacterium]
MSKRTAIALLIVLAGAGSFCFAAPAAAQDFQIAEVSAARDVNIADIKPGVIDFSDHTSPGAVDSETALTRFRDWADKHPNEKKFLALFPGYVEPAVDKTTSSAQKPEKVTEKLYMYVAQARFVLDKAPASIDLSHYVTLAFLDKIDPSIQHKLITAADISSLKDEAGTGNDNPDRKWCAGRTTSICIQSSYKLEGKIPMGIMLVNKLRDSIKKVADHIDFQSELAALAPADVDQAGLQQLTTLDTPIAGVLEQNIFYVNEIMKFGKFFAVFQAHPSDPDKTVVTAFMALAIKARVLDEKRGYERVPVLRNLVPAQVLMGQSSFNSGTSISAGLPKYARNEIKTVAGLLNAK